MKNQIDLTDIHKNLTTLYDRILFSFLFNFSKMTGILENAMLFGPDSCDFISTVSLL